MYNPFGGQLPPRIRCNKFVNWLIVIQCLYPFHGIAQIDPIPVFVSGQDGHRSYRIPAILSLPDGQLLAFCEGRVSGSGDFGDINIVMKRSPDQGKTWSAMQTVVNYDSLQAGNPAPVVDLLDPVNPGGRLFLFYNTGNNHENEIRKGNGLREVWYITSTDGGQTWSQPINITAQVHRPIKSEVNSEYRFKEDWRSYANTPGHAIQIGSGKYRGRMYIAANHSQGDPKPHFEDYFAHGYYSDDHGKSFVLSESIPIPGSNEATAAELSGDGLLMNIRNQKGDVKARIVARSRDGGSTWDTVYFDANLPDPVNEGALLNLGKTGKRHRLAFSNAADTLHRNRLTLRISRDEGKSWYKNILVDAVSGEQARDHTAYSDLVKLDRKTVGILYERRGYSQIVFRAVNWKKE
ncbi:MAG TPA: sialidase family protein [Saprospiraceae bacterium]|nr:sialidase family protein [Saprospiraceae bacterium]HNT21099.1 sialidase family protein [Saprospiraceae bacterium]